MSKFTNIKIIILEPLKLNNTKLKTYNSSFLVLQITKELIIINIKDIIKIIIYSLLPFNISNNSLGSISKT